MISHAYIVHMRFNLFKFAYNEYLMLSQKVLIWMAKQKAPNARRVIIEQ